jgi:AraC-like DNA-binding protein
MEMSRQRFPVEVSFRDSGFGLLKSHHEEGFFMDWRQDPYAKVLVIVGGEGVMEKPGSPVAIRAPMVIVVPAGRRHRLADRPGFAMSLYGICLRDTAYPGPALVRAACARWRVVADPEACRRVQESLREILAEERHQQVGSADLQLGLVARILAALARLPDASAGEAADSATRVAAYIRKMEQEFWRPADLDSVARSLGLGRRRFTDLFRHLAGESWLARLTGLRMAHAARLLAAGALTVRSVAFECGYDDIAHFYRLFKKTHGVSPGQFRRSGTG